MKAQQSDRFVDAGDYMQWFVGNLSNPFNLLDFPTNMGKLKVYEGIRRKSLDESGAARSSQDLHRHLQLVTHASDGGQAVAIGAGLREFFAQAGDANF